MDDLVQLVELSPGWSAHAEGRWVGVNPHGALVSGMVAPLARHQRHVFVPIVMWVPSEAERREVAAAVPCGMAVRWSDISGFNAAVVVEVTHG